MSLVIIYFPTKDCLQRLPIPVERIIGYNTFPYKGPSTKTAYTFTGYNTLLTKDCIQKLPIQIERVIHIIPSLFITSLLTKDHLQKLPIPIDCVTGYHTFTNKGPSTETAYSDRTCHWLYYLYQQRTVYKDYLFRRLRVKSNPNR